jgi:hypothetical protein
VLVTLIYEMIRRDVHRGIAALVPGWRQCGGDGGGTAIYLAAKQQCERHHRLTGKPEHRNCDQEVSEQEANPRIHQELYLRRFQIWFNLYRQRNREHRSTLRSSRHFNVASVLA